VDRGGFGDAERFETLHHFFFAIGPPWRKMKGSAERRFLFVFQETAGDIAAAFDEDAAGAAAIHGVEVEAVLDFGSVGVAELFVDGFLLCESFVVGAPESDVVDGAGAEGPASRRTIGSCRRVTVLLAPPVPVSKR
jgi:hypothetical protein